LAAYRLHTLSQLQINKPYSATPRRNNARDKNLQKPKEGFVWFKDRL
jgi:hypothetical protein